MEFVLFPFSSELQRYKVSGVAEFAKEMEEKGLGKPKVSLQFEMSQSGITQLIKAEAAVEETYTVEEEVEIEDETEEEAEEEETKDEESSEKSEDEEKSEDDEAAEEKKEEKKEKKTKLVEKVRNFI